MGSSSSISHADHLVLFAHGSTDPRWRETCERIADQVAAGLGPQAVTLAYLQMAEPTLTTAAADAVRHGARRLVVLPLFFSAGGHVANDLPPLVAAVGREFPELSVELMSPVGEDRRFADLVVALGREALRGA